MKRTASALVIGALLMAPAAANAETIESCLAAANEAETLRRDVTRLTKAREKLRVCALDECPEAVRLDCRKGLVEVEASLPTIVLQATDGSGSSTFDVRVTMDGGPLVEKLDGRPLIVDAGAHLFRFERHDGSGAEEVRSVLVVSQKNIPVAVQFKAPVPVGPAPTSPAPALAPSARDDAADHSSSALPVVGLVIAGAGAVGMGIGAVFGLSAASKQSDANCPGNACKDDRSVNLLKDAQSAGNLSTALFVAGGALTVGGLTMFFLSRRSSTSTAATLQPTFLSGGAGLSFAGAL